MQRQIVIGGGTLTLQDLSNIEQGSLLTPDPEGLKLCCFQNSSEPYQELPGFLNSRFAKSALALRLNSALRKKQQSNGDKIQEICQRLNQNELPSEIIQSMSFHDIEKNVLNNDWVGANTIMGIGLWKIKQGIPLQELAVALFCEHQSINSKVFDSTKYQGITPGLKTSLDNIEALLKESKQTRKNNMIDQMVMQIQALGSLRDLVGNYWRLVEKETNSDSFQLSNLEMKRAPIQLFTILAAFIQSLQLIITNTQYRNSVSNFTSEIDTTINIQLLDLFNPLNFERACCDFFDKITQINQLVQQEIIFQVEQFIQKEAKLNSGGGKPRSLPVGKGTKLAMSTFATIPNIDFDSLSQIFEAELEVRNQETRIPKLAKGMRDFSPEQMAIREMVFDTIKQVFKRHMAGELETPVMELRETLMGKYGEEGSKLIYNLADQGGEALSLRYDLTVPFARYVAMNRITKWKRYQIGKVYRRDQPQIKKGRFREFYQCDFDIVGSGGKMAQDAEILKIVIEILENLQLSFELKINHRQLLDAILEVAGCSSNKFRTISSSIDKLDKETWQTVYNELTIEKGISSDSVDIIGKYVQISGTISEVLQQLQQDDQIQNNERAQKALQEMQTLQNYCEWLQISNKVTFDLCLARGLDYYTGLVYEAILTDNAQGVGSIAGGGRYDELIMRLNNSKTPVPAIGVSLGIERMFAIIEQRYQNQQMLYTKNSVLVASAGSSQKYNLLEERWKLCGILWDGQIPAETFYKDRVNPKEQIAYACEKQIPWTVWIGEQELEQGIVRTKHMEAREETNVPVGELIEFIKLNS